MEQTVLTIFPVTHNWDLLSTQLWTLLGVLLLLWFCGYHIQKLTTAQKWVFFFQLLRVYNIQNISHTLSHLIFVTGETPEDKSSILHIQTNLNKAQAYSVNSDLGPLKNLVPIFWVMIFLFFFCWFCIQI